MSTEATPPAGTPAPAATTSTPATPAPRDEAAPKKLEFSQEAFDERLTRAERKAVEKALKELGLEPDSDKAKAKLEEWRKRDASEESELERLKKEATANATAKEEAEALRKELAAVAKDKLKGLTEDQREAVKDLAGDDPAKQLSTIRTLSKTWAKEAEKSNAEVKKGDTLADEKKPAQTMPLGNAPPSSATSPVDHKAVHAAMKARGDYVGAARYAMQNLHAIFPDNKP